MGGNSPSHLSREDGEGGGVTFVKGIRVSESSGRIMHGFEVGESIQTKLLVQTVSIDRPPLQSALVLLCHLQSGMIFL